MGENLVVCVPQNYHENFPHKTEVILTNDISSAEFVKSNFNTFYHWIGSIENELKQIKEKLDKLQEIYNK